MTHHLGYAPGDDKPAGSSNHRNGSSGKTVLTDDGPLRIDVPRDRHGAFAPQIVGKHERRFTGFDDKIVALYARGLTVREVQAHLQEMYAIDFRARNTNSLLVTNGNELDSSFVRATACVFRSRPAKSWRRRPMDVTTFPVHVEHCMTQVRNAHRD